MARFNEILSGRYNRLMQKLFSMKGGPPAPQLASEVQMVHPLFHGAENRYLEGWDRFAILSQQPIGGAGTFDKYQLFNPVGSGVIAVIERIRLTSPTTQTIQMASADSTVYGVPLATIAAVTNCGLDPRGRRTPLLVLSREATVGSLVGVVIDEVVLNNPTAQVDLIITDIQEIPVPPGFGYRWQTVSAITQFDLNLMWRERSLEDSEKF